MKKNTHLSIGKCVEQPKNPSIVKANKSKYFKKTGWITADKGHWHQREEL